MGGWEYGQVLAVEYPKVTDAQAIIVRDDKTLDISPAVTLRRGLSCSASRPADRSIRSDEKSGLWSWQLSALLAGESQWEDVLLGRWRRYLYREMRDKGR